MNFASWFQAKEIYLLFQSILYLVKIVSLLQAFRCNFHLWKEVSRIMSSPPSMDLRVRTCCCVCVIRSPCDWEPYGLTYVGTVPAFISKSGGQGRGSAHTLHSSSILSNNVWKSKIFPYYWDISYWFLLWILCINPARLEFVFWKVLIQFLFCFQALKMYYFQCLNYLLAAFSSLFMLGFFFLPFS